MKKLVYGIAFIILVGIGGFAYRNAVEHPSRPIACPLDALVCPDGTAVGRTGEACTFPACPPPNVSLSEFDLVFALPEGFSPVALPDEASIAAYDRTDPVSIEASSIIIRRFAIVASSTALETIQATAIGGASGAPVPATAFSSTVLGTHRFTVVTIERFEGVVDIAYYLSRGSEVLRFDAIDRGVDWTNPNLDTTTLPANLALRKLLVTLQGE